MKNDNYVIYNILIIFGFLILTSFYIGFTIGKNAAQRERQKTEVQK